MPSIVFSGEAQRMKIMIKLLAALFAITLFGFMSLQFNDPDAGVWIATYGLCALVPAVLVVNKFWWPLFWLAIAACLVQLVIAAPGAYLYFLHRAEEPLMQAMNPAKPYIEEAREFLGVVIALVIDLLALGMSRVLRVQ